MNYEISRVTTPEEKLKEIRLKTTRGSATTKMPKTVVCLTQPTNGQPVSGNRASVLGTLLLELCPEFIPPRLRGLLSRHCMVCGVELKRLTLLTTGQKAVLRCLMPV